MKKKPPAPDVVDAIIGQWRRELPGLPLRAMELVGRLGRVSALGTRMVEDVLARHDLKLGEFDVLAALRRAGKPYQLTPTLLYRTLMLSSGAMTNRLDRLEEAGLVERREDPADRRGTIIALTPRGVSVVERAVREHVEHEEKLLSLLSIRERDTLDELLRKILAALEGGGS